MSVSPAKIHIRYTSNGGGTTKQEIAGFCYDGMTRWNEVSKMRDGTVGEIKCLHCKSNNWTENGRAINEYECDSCGAFITVEPRN